MYRIRKADTSDISTIIEFRARMFALVWTGGGDIEEMNRYCVPFFEEKIASGEFVAWIAETEDGTPVACSALSFYNLPPKPANLDGRYGYISSMLTDEIHQRIGLGRKLLTEAPDYAKANDVTSIKLHASNYGRPLYEFMGFKSLNEMGIVLR